MNQYPHHIGDFNTETRHLSRLERAVYRDMRDMYFTNECALDGSDFELFARRLLCVTPEEVAALQFVLSEFFEQDDAGHWRNERCEKELVLYRDKQAAAGVVKSNENTRQARAREKRTKLFAALRAAGHTVHWKTTTAEAERMCMEHGVSLGRPSEPPPPDVPPPAGPPAALPPAHVPAPVTVTSPVTHAPVTANQNQNQNQIQQPPNPPGGGARASTLRSEEEGVTVTDQVKVTATALMGHFPAKCRTKVLRVARRIAWLEVSKGVTGATLLAAAAIQSPLLNAEEGKRCPSVLSWLRDSCWLDTPPGTEIAAPANWRDTRSGIEAMGASVGMPPYGDGEGQWRLLSDYQREVERRLTQREPA